MPTSPIPIDRHDKGTFSVGDRVYDEVSRTPAVVIATSYSREVIPTKPGSNPAPFSLFSVPSVQSVEHVTVRDLLGREVTRLAAQLHALPAELTRPLLSFARPK
jgi:hypothetical protein